MDETLEKDSFRPNTFIIPAEVMLDTELQPLDSKVFAVVFWLENMKDGTCYAGNARFGKILNAHIVSIQKSLARLRDRGYVEIIYREDGTRKEIMSCIAFRKFEQEGTAKWLPPHSQTAAITNINITKKKYTSNEELQAERLYKEYLIRFNKLPSEYKFTDSRKAKVIARLRDAGFDMVSHAILNLSKSAWHRGENPNGKEYCDLGSFLCRSYEKVEEWANNGTGQKEGGWDFE